jgi:hypothetical protein
MRGVAGCHIKQHLHDFHLADILRVAEAAAKEHETEGCRYAAGWRERLNAKLLEVLPDFIGDALEEEETFCPERGIGVKEAA